MTIKCDLCGLPLATVEEVLTGVARYEESPGGHADRHALVLEAAEQALDREVLGGDR